ncbi:MAG TPA: glucose 1-dehydrogenase [Dehalococcoidia bacterium]|jgi:NAD(P)-dependent dehydrogenase (short-subunit alcohol dehydrogenase family)
MTKPDFSLNGKVALVTGGSRGIGKATALAFARFGADVAVASRTQSDLEAVAEEIRGLGRKSLPVAAHVGNLVQIKNLVETVHKEFGKIDILVNNAGTSPALSGLIDIDERLWDSVMNLNLKGLVFLSQAVARTMKETGGCIINVASVDSYMHEPGIGVYSISKAGVVQATKIMAEEWAKYNIRVNAIAPGHIHTRLGDSIFQAMPDYKKVFLERVPMKRIGDPDEIVGAMVYLASSAGSYVTGTTVVVDGGTLTT